MTEKWNHCSKNRPLGLDGERILGNCQKQRRSILVRKASEDPLLKGVGQHNFCSCLCVPVLDDARFPVGLLYLSSDEEEAFTTHGRFAVEKLAREAAPHLGAPQSASVATEAEPPNDLARGALMWGVIFSAVLFALLLVGPPNSELTASQSVPVSTDSLASAREVARKFAHQLRVDELGQAWELLHPDLQQTWDRETFVESLAQWSESEGNQGVLLRRKLSGMRREEERVVAVFLATEGETEVTSWEWELQLADSHWRIFALQGGPVLSP